MIEKWKAVLNKLKVLTKTRCSFYGFLKSVLYSDHALMLAKLSAYGFDNNSLGIMHLLRSQNFSKN